MTFPPPVLGRFATYALILLFSLGYLSAVAPDIYFRDAGELSASAVSLGIAHRLREIPASLQRRTERGSDMEKAAAKKIKDLALQSISLHTHLFEHFEDEGLKIFNITAILFCLNFVSVDA